MNQLEDDPITAQRPMWWGDDCGMVTALLTRGKQSKGYVMQSLQKMGGIGALIAAGTLVPQRSTAFVSHEDHRLIEELARLVRTGAVVPSVGGVFEMTEIAEAMRALEAGSIAGKAVVVVESETEDA